MAKQTDKAVNRDGAHAVITVREGGTEEPSTPADKPQECVGPAAWLTHFMVLKKNCLPFSMGVMKKIDLLGYKHTTINTPVCWSYNLLTVVITYNL